MVLWAVGGLLEPILSFGSISLPLGEFGLVLLFTYALAYPIYLAVDAFVLARRNRDAPMKPYQRWWVYALMFLAFCVANHLVARTVRAFVAEGFVVPTGAMDPTIQPGDRILVDKLWCGPDRLRRNDVVVFRSEGPGSALYVMRVVGLPGDGIEVRHERLLLNGEPCDDPHAVFADGFPLLPEMAHFGPLTIPSDSFFVLGDNRRMSKDSRILGPIPLSDLHGRARIIYWSRDRRYPDPRDPWHYEPGNIRWDRIGARLD